MAGTIGKVTVDLEARSAGWIKGFAEAEKGAASFARKACNELKALTFEKGFGSAGIARFGGAIGHIASIAGDMATSLRTGKSAYEVFGEAVNSVPIVGTFKQAGEAIRELVFGEQAAIVEAKKMAGAAEAINAAYRKIAFNKEGANLFGFDKAKEDAKIAEDARVGELRKKNAEADAKIGEMSRSFRHLDNGYEGFSTQASYNEFKRLEADKKSNDAAINDTSEYNRKLLELDRDSGDAQLQFKHNMAIEIDEMEAKFHEKALRREGKGLESAIFAINEQTKIKKDQLSFSIRDTELDKLAGGREGKLAKERKADVAKSLMELDKDAADKSSELREEDSRRKQVEGADNDEKLKQILAEGNIERLRLTNDHLAEVAQIEEKHRQEAANIEKEYQEAKNKGLSGADENRDGRIRGADAVRRQSLALEDLKIAKEARKAWEEAGDPADKYKGKLEDINEQYQKLGDKALRAKEIQKLDRDTLKELKDLNPDRSTKVDLYGSRLNHSMSGKVHDGDSMAKEQLEAMKKTAEKAEQSNTYLQQMWDQYFKPLTTATAGAVQLLEI